MIKLKIVAYKKETFAESDKVGEYTVRFNPEKLNESYSIKYNETQAEGSSGNTPKFIKIVPNELTISILFDKTIIKTDEEVPEVDDQIEDFKALVYDYQGVTHRPNFVKLTWGTFMFKGQLKEITINYEIFDSDGVPLRARAECTFMQVIDNQTRSGLESPTSPDLTHVYLIKEGDSLPLISDKYYGDPSYYLDLARVNHLDGFRELKAGDQLVIPPLSK
jgi:hypothetical protein